MDRRAWAVAQPHKPADFDELSGQLHVRDEMAAIDPSLISARVPIAVAATGPHALDLDLLAAAAIVDADQRSASCGGRFSTFDTRAGATRALSRTGIVAPRRDLDGVIVESTARAAGAGQGAPRRAP